MFSRRAPQNEMEDLWLGFMISSWRIVSIYIWINPSNHWFWPIQKPRICRRQRPPIPPSKHFADVVSYVLIHLKELMYLYWTSKSTKPPKAPTYATPPKSFRWTSAECPSDTTCAACYLSLHQTLQFMAFKAIPPSSTHSKLKMKYDHATLVLNWHWVISISALCQQTNTQELQATENAFFKDPWMGHICLQEWF